MRESRERESRQSGRKVEVRMRMEGEVDGGEVGGGGGGGGGGREGAVGLTLCSSC